MRRDTGSTTVELRSTTAAVAVAAFAIGLTAAYDPSGIDRTHPPPLRLEARSETTRAECGPLVKCASERECYDRIAACVAGGGEWRGDDKSGRCHRKAR